jgi:hypothetical protein
MYIDCRILRRVCSGAVRAVLKRSSFDCTHYTVSLYIQFPQKTSLAISQEAKASAWWLPFYPIPLTGRLAAQAELLVLSSSRRRGLRPASEIRPAAAENRRISHGGVGGARRRSSELWDGSETSSSCSSGSESEGRRREGTAATLAPLPPAVVVRRWAGKSHRRRRQRTEWRKSLPTSLGRRRYIRNYLKGTVQRDFLPRFFHEWVPPKALTRYLKAFQSWLRIRGNIRDFD